jgi:hypothetical protein
MVVNTAHRFIFIHVPKAAGTSLAAALACLSGNRTDWLARTKHETLAAFLAAIPHRITPRDRELGLDPRTYSRCAFVRNPWDRLASLYRYLVEQRPRPEIDGVGSFRHFLMLARDRTPWVTGLHSMRQQIDFLSQPDGALEVAFLGHFEHLPEDTLRLGTCIGAPLLLPHLNRSSNADNDYRRSYDPETIAVVEVLFADDIRHFGYSFETAAPSRRISGPLRTLR